MPMPTTAPIPRYTGLTIDYGHGGMISGVYQTAGKQYHHERGGQVVLSLYEGVSNRQTAFRLILHALAAGVVVFDCVADRFWTSARPPRSWRDLEQRDVPLSIRIARANRYPSHLLVSPHSNAVGNSIRGTGSAARGAEVYTSPGQTDSDEVATSLYDAFVEAFADEPMTVRRGDMTDGDPDKEADFAVTRDSIGSAVLGEVGFFTNLDDARYLNSEHGQDIIAAAYWAGIAGFMLTATGAPMPDRRWLTAWRALRTARMVPRRKRRRAA